MYSLVLFDAEIGPYKVLPLEASNKGVLHIP